MELFRVRDVADRLGCTPQRVYQLIAAGEIPHVRTSARSIRIPRDAWDAYMAVLVERSIESLRANDVAPAGNGRDATTTTAADGPRDDAILRA